MSIIYIFYYCKNLCYLFFLTLLAMIIVDTSKGASSLPQHLVLFHSLVMLDYCHEKVQNKVQNTVGIVEFEIESVTKGLVMIA